MTYNRTSVNVEKEKRRNCSLMFDCFFVLQLVVEKQSRMRLQVVLTVCGFEDVFSPLQTPEWRPVIPFVLHWRRRLQQLLFYLWDKAYGTSTT